VVVSKPLDFGSDSVPAAPKALSLLPIVRIFLTD
jgi:hypothetical protein